MKLEPPSGRLLTLFVTGDDPRSLRTVELDNWSGMAVMGRAPYFKKALEREELKRSCVYFLVESANADDIPNVYVGESDDFAQRYTSTKFPIEFDQFVVFTNKDDKLTRAHVKWLELKIWELLTDNQGNVAVANKATPTGSKLPEADRASMLTFTRNMIYVLDALGFDFFEPPDIEKAKDKGATTSTPAPLLGDNVFITNALPLHPNAKAYLEVTESSYVLKAGSLIAKVVNVSLPPNLAKLREQLIHEGTLVDYTPECLQLQKDIPFAKPSPASALVRGRTSNGYTEWARQSDNVKLGTVLTSV